MSLTILIILAGGAMGVLLMIAFAFSGPSQGKALKRRMELIKERHAEGVLAASANAQIRKLFSNRGKVDSFASTLIPKPALLRKRLEQTGRPWTLVQYAAWSAGLVIAVAVLMLFKGAPWYLALVFGCSSALGCRTWSSAR